MSPEQAKQLLQKYRLGLCSEEEKQAIEAWYNSLADQGEWSWAKSEKQTFKERLKDTIDGNIKMNFIEPTVKKQFRFWRLMAAAVLFLFIAAVPLYFLFRPSHADTPVAKHPGKPLKNDVTPGMDGAVLVLAGGNRINIDSTSGNVIAKEGDVNIVKKNGHLVYENNNGLANANTGFNSIITPRARQFHFTLADGTGVWLNAASSIRYPVVFNADVREVEITGEVYFEVAQIKAPGKPEGKIPFIVKINKANNHGGQVEVLGTHFNINAYDDEEFVKTTLVEGKVKVSHNNQQLLLTPGNQSILDKKGNIRLSKNVDTEQILAWKNGYFSFDKTDIASAMRQLERWYDIKVVFQDGKIPEEYFWGDVSRNSSLSVVLKAFEMSGIKFMIDGNNVTVLRKR